MTARRLSAWLLPGVVVSACFAIGLAGFSYHWQRPELSEMQVLQAIPEWWASGWPVFVALLVVYVVRTLRNPEWRP